MIQTQPTATDPISAGISIAGQAGLTWLDYQMQKKLIQQQNEYNNQQYEKQRADNLEFWKIQNEYNSPYSQMLRYKEAGLNPLLMYGNTNTSSATLQGATAPMTERPEIKMNPMDLINNLMGVMSLMSLSEDIKGKRIENEIKDKTKNTEIETKIQNLINLRGNAEEVQEKINEIKLKNENQKKQNEILNKTAENIIKKLEIEVKNEEQQNQLLEIEKRVKEITLKKNNVEIEKIKEEIKKIKQEIENEEVKNELS